MNLFRMAVLSAFLLGTVSAMGADAPDAPVKDSIFVNIGSTRPISPSNFTTSQDYGYNGGIGFGFGLSKLFQLVLDANEDVFPLNKIAYSQIDPNAAGGEMRVGTFLANIRFRFLAQDNPVVPYLIAGMGAARVEQDAITNNGSAAFPAASSTNFAARFGIGIDIRLSPLTSLFVESSGYGISGSNGGDNLTYDTFRLGGKFNL